MTSPATGPLREITVGPAQADVVGCDNRAIQLAIDALAFRGGGTVRVLAGEYECADSVHLRSNINLIGVPGETVLRLAPVVSSPLAVDADIGQKVVTPESAANFRPGMGLVLRDLAKPNQISSMPLTITAVADGKLYLSDYIAHDWNAEEEAMAVNYVPLVHGFELCNVVVDGLVLDAKPSRMIHAVRGLWGACLYLRRCHGGTLRRLVARNCLGDGLRFGQGDHITVEDCEAAGNSEYGVHPGSHSPHTIVRRCDIHHNGSDGLYLCWGVDHGTFEENEIHHNGAAKNRNGLCIGHKDTDNLIARNHIFENAKHGIHFRVKTEANGAHRNYIRENVIENNGPAEDGTGVHIEGITHDLLFDRNIIRETRSGQARTQRHAFVIKPGVTRVRLVDNVIEGHPGDAIVDEAHSPDNHL